MRLAFVETEVFTYRIARLGLEQDLRHLQTNLLEKPDAGRLDAGTGGLRKVRMPSKVRAKGKSGGARVHYLYVPRASTIYLMFVYAKNEDETLTPDPKKQLSRIAKAIRAEL